MMKKLLASTAIALTATSALAGPTCNAPEDQWMKESELRARLEGEGYQIKTFKVSSGKCYEIYGFDKDGKKVEIYFDPVSGAVLETKG
jgi:hypothetical protein